MRWIVQHCDILDIPADVLICSANVFLNLSGGVGGALLLRYGDELQHQLHAYLKARNLHFLQRGDVVPMTTPELPYRAVLHAVAVDAFYQSSPEVVADIVDKSLRIATGIQAKRVALTALGTGFGRLKMKQFAEGVATLLGREYAPLETVVIGVRNVSDADDFGHVDERFEIDV